MTIGLPFRRFPDIGPTGKVTILGVSRCGADRMNRYAARRNPRAPGLADLYLTIGELYGVRGDVAFCQAMYDTRAWTVLPGNPPWRPFAYTIWGEMLSGPGHDRQEQQVELHIQYLHAFATTEAPEKAAALPEYRMSGLTKAGLSGSAAHWEDLNGKWVVPGSRYGQDVVAIWRSMMEWRGEGEPLTDIAEEDEPTQANKRNRAGERTSEQMEWLRGQGLLPSPAPHPDKKVTWHELAGLLRSWEERAGGK